MAVYFTLGIDCGCFQNVADQLERHFDKLKIALPGIPDAECEVWRKENSGHWFIGVWPRGMGYATLRFHRPELLSDENQATIKKELYHHLSGLSGYRRALFGGEAFDLFSESNAEDLMDYHHTDLVYSEREFTIPPPGKTVGHFSPGYSIVTGSVVEPAPAKGPALRQK